MKNKQRTYLDEYLHECGYSVIYLTHAVHDRLTKLPCPSVYACGLLLTGISRICCTESAVIKSREDFLFWQKAMRGLPRKKFRLYASNELLGAIDGLDEAMFGSPTHGNDWAFELACRRSHRLSAYLISLELLNDSIPEKETAQ